MTKSELKSYLNCVKTSVGAVYKWLRKRNESRNPFFRIFLVPAPFSHHLLHYLFLLFVTGWGSSPPLAQQSLNGSCMFCWVPSSRTWAAWRCPPRRGLWPPGEPGPSGCPPSLGRPLWRTWRAPWPCWKIKAHAVSKSSLEKWRRITDRWVSLTSSTPPSDTTGSETQRPQTNSHCTEPPQVCSVTWDLPKRTDYITICTFECRLYEYNESSYLCGNTE